MSTCIRVPGGIITLAEVAAMCPECRNMISDDISEQLEKSKKGLIYRMCKVCRCKVGITADMKGDIVTWLKKDEKQQQ